MNQTSLLMKEPPPATRAEPLYRVVVANAGAAHAEWRIRRVIERKRGDLKSLFTNMRRPNQMHVHLGLRRIDDVLAAIEGAGFDVSAVLVTH